jgi:hypothetical protein
MHGIESGKMVEHAVAEAGLAYERSIFGAIAQIQTAEEILVFDRGSIFILIGFQILETKRCSLWTTRSSTSLKDEGGGGETVSLLCPAGAVSTAVADGVDELSSCETAGRERINNATDREPT